MRRKIREQHLKQELHQICSLKELWITYLLGESTENVKALL